MIREFFCNRGLALKAWGGLALILGHGLLRAFIKFKMNTWYGAFYDVGGEAVEVSSGDEEGLRQGQERVLHMLGQFALLCLPSVFLHPVYKFLTNLWVLLWRKTLIESYLVKWSATEDVSRVENGAQRVHEDTQRFARGLSTLVVTLLDSVLTLAVFSPLLVQLGSKVKIQAGFPDSWLLLLCVAIALAGIAGSVFFGWSLIELEIANQRVEADLRRDLVLLEESGKDAKSEQFDLSGCIKQLVKNYKTLYGRFAIFSVWLAVYEQSVVLTPYVLAAPLLYSLDASTRITLGLVTQISHSFSQVFSSLNILTDNWVDVTDWISVIKRLIEFEAYLEGKELRKTNTRSQLMEMVTTVSDDTSTSCHCHTSGCSASSLASNR